MKCELPFKTYSYLGSYKSMFEDQVGEPAGEWVRLSDLREWAKRLADYLDSANAGNIEDRAIEVAEVLSCVGELK